MAFLRINSSLLFLMLLWGGFPCPVYPDESQVPSGGKSVMILPFRNYCESDKSYLSNYIPELLYKNLKTEDAHRIIDPENTAELIISGGGGGGAVFSRNSEITALLEKYNADIGIAGRFLVQGESIRIDIRAVYKEDGSVLEGRGYEGVVDSRFLHSLDKFAASRADWIRKYVIGGAIPDYLGSGKFSFTGLVNRISSSGAGKVLLSPWPLSVIIIISFIVLSKLLVVFFEKVLAKLALRTETTVDDRIVEHSKKPAKWAVVFTGIKLGLLSMGLPVNISILVDNLVTSVIVVLVTVIFFKSSDTIIRAWGANLSIRIDKRIEKDLIPLFLNFSRFMICAFALIIILSKFDLDIAPIMASLGIVGIAIGFALKDSLANVVSGIFLTLDRSFSLGDKVTIDDVTGIITEIGLKNTKLTTYDNEVVIIPNSELVNKRYKNYVLPDPAIRVVIRFSIAYGEDPEKAEKVVVEALKKMDSILSDPEPVAHFLEMGDFSLNFEAKVWVPDYLEQYLKKIEMNKVVYRALNEAGISIPFPTQTVYINSQT